MIDFNPVIKRNLSLFQGIVESQEKMDNINLLLQRIEIAGHLKLINNFCSQTDPDRAWDFLFELWICDLLSKDARIKNLKYEPEPNPPDFRFNIEDCQFDLQVKRLHNINNEMTKLLFTRECKLHLSKIMRPWFINFWVSNSFEKSNLNNFFQHIKSNIKNYKVAGDMPDAMLTNQYTWEVDDNILIQFSFMENNSGELGITPGIIRNMGTENNLFERIDVESIRKSIKRKLKEASETLRRPVSDKQSNLVVIQAENNLYINRNVMLNVLYGDESNEIVSLLDGSFVHRNVRSDNGLFNGRTFSKINGVILVSQESTPLDNKLSGDYYANPKHLNLICSHPILFNEVPFLKLNEWSGIAEWQPLE